MTSRKGPLGVWTCASSGEVNPNPGPNSSATTRSADVSARSSLRLRFDPANLARHRDKVRTRHCANPVLGLGLGLAKIQTIRDRFIMPKTPTQTPTSLTVAVPNESRDTKSLPRMTLETCDANAWLRPKQDVHAGPVRKQTKQHIGAQCARGGEGSLPHGEKRGAKWREEGRDAPKPKLHQNTPPDTPVNPECAHPPEACDDARAPRAPRGSEDRTSGARENLGARVQREEQQPPHPYYVHRGAGDSLETVVGSRLPVGAARNPKLAPLSKILVSTPPAWISTFHSRRAAEGEPPTLPLTGWKRVELSPE